MTEKDLLDIHVLERKKFNLLKEVLDLSEQMGKAMDSNDETTFRMVLVLRHEPIEKLNQLKEGYRTQLKAMDNKDREYVKKLLANEITGSNDKEVALKNQAISTSELLEKVVALDTRINKRIAGEESVYKEETTPKKKYGESNLKRPKPNLEPITPKPPKKKISRRR